MKQRTFSNQISMVWNRLPLILRSVFTGFIVSSIGIAIWTFMFSKIAAPWSVLPMIIALWAYLKFFSGRWRSTKLSPSVWKKSILAAILFVIIVQASFVITFRLVDFPSEKFTADYRILDNMPLWVAFTVLIMSSIVAGICEETGFQFHMQTIFKTGIDLHFIIWDIVFILALFAFFRLMRKISPTTPNAPGNPR
jgi:hypothetical protein